jgi:hypothetical protein
LRQLCFSGISHNQANDKADITNCFIFLTDWREFFCERPERTDFIKKQPSMRRMFQMISGQRSLSATEACSRVYNILSSKSIILAYLHV